MPPQHSIVSEFAIRTPLIGAIARRRSTQNAASTPLAMGLGTAHVMIWSCWCEAQQRRERPVRDAPKATQPVWLWEMARGGSVLTHGWLYISFLIYNHPTGSYPKNDVVICVISSAIGTAGGEYRRTIAGFAAVFRGLGQALWNREPRRTAV